MTIEMILVASDLSGKDDIALQRAQRIAQAHDASVKLLHMPPDAKLPAAVDLGEAARGMDLVVLPHRHERSTAAFFRGQPVLRLLRTACCPVLVTRQPHDAAWRRILVAVDFSAESEKLVRFAADLDAHAPLELFHAVDTLGEARLRAAEATEQAVRAYRERCLRHARERMLTLSDSFVARRNRLLTAIGRGDPGRQVVVQQERSDADLVVVGKRRSSAWEDFFCGSVAHRVLSWGTSDVLVVPLGLTPATAPRAARRISLERRTS
jgi:nucleotide-binding universal stress UspA family protein